MTRRRIVFIDGKTQQIYSTPEFNGDKSEFLRLGSIDKCDKDWPDILELFSTVETLSDFIIANEKAQKCYHSFLEKECPVSMEPVQEVGLLNSIKADEIIRLNF